MNHLTLGISCTKNLVQTWKTQNDLSVETVCFDQMGRLMTKQENHSSTQKSRRKKLRIPILITRIKDDDKGKTFFGYAKDISQGGMFIQSVNPKNVNEQFQIEFLLPEEKELIRGTVEVVWKRQFRSHKHYEPGMGIRFLDINEDKSTEINKWVEDRLKGDQPSFGGILNYD